MSAIKVLLVEDDPLFRDTLASYIKKEPDILIAGQAGTKEEAVSHFQNTEIDVVLMDIMLTENNCDGFEAVDEMLAIKPVKVIMLTSLDADEMIIDAFTTGAVNYLTKANYKEIPNAIRNAHFNHSSIHPDAAAALRDELGRMKREELQRMITPAEKDILALMEQGHTKSQIQKILHVSENTIKTHVHRIIKKLGVKTGREAAKKAKRKGLF